MIAVPKNWPKKLENKHAEYFAEMLGLFQKDTPKDAYYIVMTKDFLKPVPAFKIGELYVVSSWMYYYIYEKWEVAVK